MSDSKPRVIPRQMPEGVIPLIAVEGSAYDCGREYAEIVRRRYPTFRAYLDSAWEWHDLPDQAKRLVEQRAPYLLDLYRGLMEVAGPPQAKRNAPQAGGCTSFALHPAVTLDAAPISGQTKDTPLNRVERYIVLRMRITGAPTIMVLAYPGEVLGYGFWTTGMSIFRNSLFSSAGNDKGIDAGVLMLLSMACRSVDEVAELSLRHGRKDMGSTTFSDAAGNAISVESNAGGTVVVRSDDGIHVHTNHPLHEATRAYEAYEFEDLKPDSIFRYEDLRRRFERERGRLTPQKVLMLLGEHGTYPLGTCKHKSQIGDITTAVVIAQPTLGRLHVVRGQPCCNWAVTYTV